MWLFKYSVKRCLMHRNAANEHRCSLSTGWNIRGNEYHVWAQQVLAEFYKYCRIVYIFLKSSK